MTGNHAHLDFPYPPADALIESFCGGYSVRVSLKGDNHHLKPDFEKLIDVPEIWAMCFRKAKHNQWRLIGRFVERDLFVGLALHQRSFLAQGQNYAGAALQVAALWQSSTLPPPLVSDQCAAYFSGTVLDVYADPL